MMPRNQETTSVEEAPSASSDPFRARATGPDDTAPVDPAPEGEWVAGSRGPSVPGQQEDPAAEDAGDDPGEGTTSSSGGRSPSVTDPDFRWATDTTPAVDADSDPSMATPPAVDADASPAAETAATTDTPATGNAPATDGATPVTGSTPAPGTAPPLDQPVTGAHAAPPAPAPGRAGAGLDAVGAAFVTDADGYRASWVRIQSAFIDDPRGSVTDAADLVAQITGALVSAVQERERSLRGGWDSGDADTEVLRNALRDYRSFFERLMEV
jgi:hypothetical protein